MAELIDGLVERFRIGEAPVEERIAQHWTWLVGEHHAQRCAPQRLTDQGRRLLIFAATAVLCQELQFQKRSILQRLHEIPGCEGIRELVIRTG